MKIEMLVLVKCERRVRQSRRRLHFRALDSNLCAAETILAKIFNFVHCIVSILFSLKSFRPQVGKAAAQVLSTIEAEDTRII